MLDSTVIKNRLIGVFSVVLVVLVGIGSSVAVAAVAPEDVVLGSSTDEFVTSLDSAETYCVEIDTLIGCNAARVVTSFSVRAGSVGGSVQLKLFQFLNPKDTSSTATVVASSSVETAEANKLNTFDTRIPLVEDSDVLAGIATVGTGPELSYVEGSESFHTSYSFSPVPSSSFLLASGTKTTSSSVNLDLTVEGDNDGDGYGDVTQDDDDDNDGVVDGVDNCRLVSNASQANIDLDSYGDACDSDDDDDGSPEFSGGEMFGTSVTDRDSDDDGLKDGDESIPRMSVPFFSPAAYETLPNDFDSDDDGLGDGLEVGVTAGVDGIGSQITGTDSSVFTADSDSSTTTDPIDDDSDDDGLKDGEEDVNHNGRVDSGETDPNLYDTDGDGRSDRQGPKVGEFGFVKASKRLSRQGKACVKVSSSVADTAFRVSLVRGGSFVSYRKGGSKRRLKIKRGIKARSVVKSQSKAGKTTKVCLKVKLAKKASKVLKKRKGALLSLNLKLTAKTSTANATLATSTGKSKQLKKYKFKK